MAICLRTLRYIVLDLDEILTISYTASTQYPVDHFGGITFVANEFSCLSIWNLYKFVFDISEDDQIDVASKWLSKSTHVPGDCLFSHYHDFV